MKNSIFNAVCKTRYLALLVVLIFTCGNVWGDNYVLTYSKNSSGNSDYTKTYSVTVGGVTWVGYGNISAEDALRVGGKNTTNTDRTITTTTAGPNIEVSSLTLSHNGTGNGKNSSITINSIKLEVANNSSFTSADVITKSSPSVSSAGSLVFEPTSGNWAKKSYYRITVNYKISGSNNCYLKVTGITLTEASSCTSITPSLSYASVGGTTLTVGSSSTGAPTITGNTGSGAVTYSSSDNDVATVNASGIVTAVAAGTATITASIAANGGYCSGSATANFTINLPTYTVSFSTGTGNPSVSSRTEASGGAGITLPAGPTPACSSDGWVFAGWGKTEVNDVTVAPRLYMPGDKYYPESDETLYAVYRKLTSGTSTATFTASDRSNLTLISSGTYRPAWWVHTATGVELYIEDYGIYSNTFDIDNTINNGDGWAIIDAHSKIASIALTVSSGYAVDDIDTDAGSAELSGSGTSQTITCSGDVTQIYLYAADNGESIIITFTITYYNAKFNSNPTCVACDKQVTITKGTPESGGSFDLDKTGAQDCCNPLVVTISNIVAPSGKQFSAITQSGIAAGNVTIDQNAKTVTYAANSNGASTINVTFVDLPKYTVTLEDDGTELEQASYGASVNLPTRTGCDGYKFAGWTKTWTSPQSSWTSTAPAIINAGNYTPTGNENLYPVYTKVESGGTPETVTLYDEPFTGSAHSTGVESTNVAATTDMFVDGSATVWSHYSFDAASTAAYANNYGGETISDGIKIKREANNTTVTMMEVTGIKISGASDLELSLCNRRTAASATLNISYKIDDGSYTAVGGTISYNSTNDTWKKCTGLTISGTGTSLDLKIELIVSGTTNRTMVLDDIKITGETGGSTTYYISVPSCCENIVPAPVVTGTSTKSTITLSWTNVTGANGYTVTCSGGTPGEVTSSGNNRTCEITGLDPNTAYTWTVVATYTSPYCQATAANGSTTTQQVYTVSYNKNGGSSVTVSPLPASANYAAGEPVTVAAKPNTTTNAGYAFTGWNTQQDGAGTHYDADGTKTFVMPANAVVLYAEWTAKKHYYVDRMHGNWDGEHTVTIGVTVYNCYLRAGAYTVPDLSDNSTGSNSCVTGHEHFIGWVNSSYVGAQGQLISGYTIIKGGSSQPSTADGTIYYAVWAEE